MTTAVRDLYPEVEQAVRPILLSHAKRISDRLGIPMDDALQEVRWALYNGMQGYDYNRSHGRIHRFVDRVLRNSAASIIYKATTAARMPHTVYTEGGQVKVAKHRRFLSLDQIGPDDERPSFQPVDGGPTPEDAYVEAETAHRRAKLKMMLINKLSERELVIFNCLSQPTEAFLIYMQNVGADEPTHTVIAGFLGVSKNTVDYATLTTRAKFTKLVEREFPDLIKGHIEKGTWPMIHVSRASKPDTEFVAETIKRRGLDPRPLNPARDIELAGGWARDVHSYPWGVVLILKREDTYRTLVIEGRFNKISGGVAGADGTWKYVSDEVPWYPQLVRELKA